MYNIHPRKLAKRRGSKFKWAVIVAVIAVIGVGSVLTLHGWYVHELRPVSSSQANVFFTVNQGDTKHQIATNLKHAGLIRSSSAFETYVRGNDVQILQAGTYSFNKSLSVQQMVHAMITGDVAKNLLTILPGKHLDQIEQTFIQAGYTKAQVDSAFDPTQYADEPALDSLPMGASLEGYLYPDSFQRQSNTPAETIIRESLTEMNNYLTESMKSALADQGLNFYQGITLASIVEQETSNPTDQPIVAQVFLSRLKQNMALGSDVTAIYASAVAGVKTDLNINSPYNTLIHTGLPPGPISNFTENALRAVAHPATTDYLYFVSGDDGVMHYSHTEAEHNAAAQQYCIKKCGR